MSEYARRSFRNAHAVWTEFAVQDALTERNIQFGMIIPISLEPHVRVNWTCGSNGQWSISSVNAVPE